MKIRLKKVILNKKSSDNQAWTNQRNDKTIKYRKVYTTKDNKIGENDIQLELIALNKIEQCKNKLEETGINTSKENKL